MCVNVEEVAVRCPDVDVAQRCSSSAECPLLLTKKGLVRNTPGRHRLHSLSDTGFHRFSRAEDSLTIYNTLEI
ncbi:hypothetical protein EPR50_G00212260 [Perca flavescens]|uniref:Uncharacterized protein n=1 Tax=Perca flavescens TaxID=8167 RepID=A0A484C8B7_PERFV|nr:hypothetical protein EPR50_G00212260 [Perca flavescens]